MMNSPSTSPRALRLAEITPDNVRSAWDLKVNPDQERFVAPVVNSLAEAYAERATAWPRLVLDGERAVAFVMANFAPDEPEADFRCGLWRLNVAAGEQGRGYGRFAVDAVCQEARRRGQKRLTVLWEEGQGGPREFYLKLGFRPTGRVLFGETVAELQL